MFSSASEIVILLLLIIANGIFALSELAIISARKIRLEQLSQQDKRAEIALKLANEPNQILSTVQIGITLIGIFAGAYGGANLASELAILLSRVPYIAPYSQAIALAIVVIIITYLSLVIGELVPKRLALGAPERIAILVAFPLYWLSKFASPIVNLLSVSTNFILRLLGINTTSNESPITEEELKVMLRQGAEAGMFEEVEHDMVERVLELGERKVGTIMTTRPEIVWLDLDDTAEVNRQLIVDSSHTRFPVCQGSLDEVLGVIEVTDLLADCFNNNTFDLTKTLRQPLFVPESTRGLKVLELFQQSGNHMALVVDEYGVIQGLVSRKDILEAIVGDLPGINQIDSPQILQREDGSWLIDGIVSIEDFKDLLEVETLPGEKQGNYHTLGGFIITYLGRIPQATDYFIWNNFRIEVIDMDGNRIDKILVMPLVRRDDSSQVNNNDKTE